METTYEKMEEVVRGFGCKHVIFSMFKTVSDKDEWIVSYPDLLSEEPAFKGKVQFQIDYWRVSDDIVNSPVLTDPTWKEVLLAVDKLLENGDGCGVFLEALDKMKTVDGVTIYECCIGS